MHRVMLRDPQRRVYSGALPQAASHIFRNEAICPSVVSSILEMMSVAVSAQPCVDGVSRDADRQARSTDDIEILPLFLAGANETSWQFLRSFEIAGIECSSARR